MRQQSASHSFIQLLNFFLFSKSFPVWRVSNDYAILFSGCEIADLHLLELNDAAKACFIGRAWAYALGAGGRPMVAKMLGTLRAELSTAMVLTGCTAARDADKLLLDVAP